MKLLCCDPKPAESLCIFGAGNCNDVDLNILLSRFDHLALVDIDSAAVRDAVARQLGSSTDRVWVSPSVDVSGIHDQLNEVARGLSANAPDTPLPELLQVVHQPISLATDRAEYECVASVCLLSQIIDSIGIAVGQGSPLIGELALAVRKQHWKLLLSKIRTGGRGVVVFDFLSTVTLPHLMQIDAKDLDRKMMEALAARNFFTGLNPFSMRAWLQQDAELSELISEVTLVRPWRWDIGVKQFAVSAIAFRKR